MVLSIGLHSFKTYIRLYDAIELSQSTFSSIPLTFKYPLEFGFGFIETNVVWFLVLKVTFGFIFD